MKKIFSTILFLFCFGVFSVSYAAPQINATINQVTYEPVPAPPQIEDPTKIIAKYSDCVRIFAIPAQNLFYLTLAAVNANNYNVVEMQSQTPTFIFKAYNKEFVVIISAKDSKNCYMKILPSDNIYNFSLSFVLKIFDYIDLNKYNI